MPELDKHTLDIIAQILLSEEDRKNVDVFFAYLIDVCDVCGETIKNHNYFAYNTGDDTYITWCMTCDTAARKLGETKSVIESSAESYRKSVDEFVKKIQTMKGGSPR